MIWVTFQKEGIHKYPAALTDPTLATGDEYDVSFLGYPHRHTFHFKVWIQVTHNDRDIEFIRPLWVDIVQKAADFMARYRDPRTGLPLPSYDLWEERWGVHAFTVATVYGGLKAAHNFAVAFGDRRRAVAARPERRP